MAGAATSEDLGWVGAERVDVNPDGRRLGFCSGAMYCGVPTGAPRRLRPRDTEVIDPGIAVAVNHYVGRLQIAVPTPLALPQSAGAPIRPLLSRNASDTAEQRREVSPSMYPSWCPVLTLRATEAVGELRSRLSSAAAPPGLKAGYRAWSSAHTLHHPRPKATRR